MRITCCVRVAPARLAGLLLLMVAAEAWLAPPLFAQTLRVEGTVRDATGQPIRGATITADSTAATTQRRSVVSDERGRYSLRGLSRGSWLFTVAAPGYESSQRRTELPLPRGLRSLDFQLDRPSAGSPLPGVLPGISTREIQAQLDVAEQLMRDQRYNEAIAIYQAMLARAPVLSTLNLLIGEAYRAKKEPDKALAAFREVLKVNPLSQQAAVGTARIYLDQGDHRAAEQALLLVASRADAGRDALFVMGEAKLGQDDTDAAARWFRKAAELDPTWIKPVFRLGVIAANRNDRATALALLKQAMVLAPESAEAVQAQALIAQLTK